MAAMPATKAEVPPCKRRTAKSLDMFVEKSTESATTLSVFLLLLPPILKKVGGDQPLCSAKISLRSVLKSSTHQAECVGNLCHPELLGD